MKKLKYLALIILYLVWTASVLHSQMITGVWKGKINGQKVEVKIIQKGDALTGTSYYYTSADNYRRYGISGYFNPHTNEAVWWDNELLEEKTGRFSSPGKVPLLSRADFNCPGGGRMMLDGKVSRPDSPDKITGDVDLDKTSRATFQDEWDFVIDNYTVGANDPTIIDSISMISYVKKPVVGEAVGRPKLPIQQPVTDLPENTVVEMPRTEPKIEAAPIQLPNALTIEEKFQQRKKVFTTEIPVSGDSIELRFYDNAQIDGDSISLFLNDKLLFEHIRLTGNAYTVKLPVNELNETNELIMVAENLGSIPPNTSYMVAIAGEKKYEARLESTEGSSAMIRLKKARTKE